jgi:hypothetical protein
MNIVPLGHGYRQSILDAGELAVSEGWVIVQAKDCNGNDYPAAERDGVMVDLYLLAIPGIDMRKVLRDEYVEHQLCRAELEAEDAPLRP